jgi:enamine deaminase RidA (YjgF/YER057c/UK114 family)
MAPTHADIERWSGTATGRNRVVAYGGVIWTVANAMDRTAPFAAQVAQTLAMLDANLALAGSARTHLVSLQVILTDIAKRDEFETQWSPWIGADAAYWPQRACYESGLAPGLLIELVVVAAPMVATNLHRNA